MDKNSRVAVCYTNTTRVTDEDYPDIVTRLLEFGGWSIIADQETRIEPESDVSVYFEGDQGRLSIAGVSDVEEFLVEEEYDEAVEVDVPLYFPTQAEQREVRFSSEVFVRDKGKEDTFWFPSPTYLFDTETTELLEANSVDFDPEQFVDGFIFTEDDVESDEVVHIKNVRTGASDIFDREFVENELGGRFHAIKPVL